MTAETLQDRAKRRHRFLTPVAFGVHHAIGEDIRHFFEETLGHSSFFFYEFFLGQPVTRWTTRDQVMAVHQTATAPFLSRIAHKKGFIPALDLQIVQQLRSINAIESVPLTPSNLQKYWKDGDTMEFNFADADLMQLLLGKWMGWPTDRVPAYYSPSRSLRLDEEKGIVAATSGLSANVLRNSYPKTIIQRVKRDPKYASTALALLREYELVLRPWLQNRETKEVAVVAVTISSASMFWGQCIVVSPFQPKDRSRDTPEWLTNLKCRLRKAVEQTYTPMLTLLENYICEAELDETLKIDGIEDHAMPLPDTFNYGGLNTAWLDQHQAYLRRVGSGETIPSSASPTEGLLNLESSSNIFVSLLRDCANTEDGKNRWLRLNKMERALVELWADRLGFVMEDSKAIRESLVFAKYLIASPSMINCTRQAIALRHITTTKRKRSVKTALVIGGPGSGKDSMAQLVWLFSPGYRFGRRKTLNMAMFRPKEAAVPLLLGLETERDLPPEDGRQQAPVFYSIKGILRRALEESQMSSLQNVKEKGDGGLKRGFTFILDELNSLDMDTQGALLRLLENAELQPLGGMDRGPEMDLLVIGVMNEEPQLIMKRRAMDGVLRDKQLFGGVLGEVLYELFRRQRRLRDDLYYRLIRGGEIHLPELRHRVEDIPILFYFIVSTELRPLIDSVAKDYEVELSVYEALIDPPLEWQGNLRELQTVARHIVAASIEQHEEKRPEERTLVIRGIHARCVLDKHRKVMASPGMDSDSS